MTDTDPRPWRRLDIPAAAFGDKAPAYAADPGTIPVEAAVHRGRLWTRIPGPEASAETDLGAVETITTTHPAPLLPLVILAAWATAVAPGWAKALAAPKPAAFTYTPLGPRSTAQGDVCCGLHCGRPCPYRLPLAPEDRAAARGQ